MISSELTCALPGSVKRCKEWELDRTLLFWWSHQNHHKPRSVETLWVACHEGQTQWANMLTSFSMPLIACCWEIRELFPLGNISTNTKTRNPNYQYWACSWGIDMWRRRGGGVVRIQAISLLIEIHSRWAMSPQNWNTYFQLLSAE